MKVFLSIGTKFPFLYDSHAFCWYNWHKHETSFYLWFGSFTNQENQFQGFLPYFMSLGTIENDKTMIFKE